MHVEHCLDMVYDIPNLYILNPNPHPPKKKGKKTPKTKQTNKKITTLQLFFFKTWVSLLLEKNSDGMMSFKKLKRIFYSDIDYSQ